MVSIAFQIAVVATIDGGQRVGRKVTSCMLLGADPAGIVIAIHVRGLMIDLIRMSKMFSASFLSEGHQATADASAVTVAAGERFAQPDWGRWPSGNVKLTGSVVAIGLRVVRLHEC